MEEEGGGDKEMACPPVINDVKKYSERKDSASWVYEHWEPVDGEDGPKRKFSCKYCKNAQYRHNVTRMRNHLLNCSLVPPQVKEVAGKRCEAITSRKALKEKEKKERGGDEATSASPSSKKRKGMDAEARGLLAEAKKIDMKEAHNKFGRALASLQLESNAVNDKKLEAFIQMICPQYEYPTEKQMKAVFVTLKLAAGNVLGSGENGNENVVQGES